MYDPAPVEEGFDGIIQFAGETLARLKGEKMTANEIVELCEPLAEWLKYSMQLINWIESQLPLASKSEAFLMHDQIARVAHVGLSLASARESLLTHAVANKESMLS